MPSYSYLASRFEHEGPPQLGVFFKIFMLTSYDHLHSASSKFVRDLAGIGIAWTCPFYSKTSGELALEGKQLYKRMGSCADHPARLQSSARVSQLSY